MNPDGWGKLAEWNPDAATDLQRADHFLDLIGTCLEGRKGRLQRALGVQHFILSTEAKGVVLLAKSGLWLPILQNAASIFRIAVEGIYLSEHPGKVNDFVEFSWYEANREEGLPRTNHPYPDIANESFQRRQEKVARLHSTGWNRKSWHKHDLESVAMTVGLDYLLPLFCSSFSLAGGRPAGFMSMGKGGILLLDRHREKLTPAIAASDAIILVCHSLYHFYRALLRAFDVSNDMVLQAFDDLQESLSTRKSGTE
jgi:hypothetical protein